MLLDQHNSDMAACHNLRYSAAPPGLSTVAAPQAVVDRPVRMFCEFDTDGYSFIGADGLALVVFRPIGRDIRPVCTLPDEPLRAIFINNVVTVTTEKGEYYIDYNAADDTFAPRGYDTAAPAVSIEAAGSATITATVPRATLSKAATAGHRLSDADVNRLAADLADGYAQLLASAAFGGNFLQPCFACYRLLDASGREIFRSQPCLVSLPSGLQLASPVTLSAVDSSFTAVESYRIEAEAMRMRVNIDAPTSADAGKDVARLEVWVSPQLHPFDPSQRARCRMISRTTSAEFATLYLPGAEGPLSIATSAGRHMVDALVATAAADNFASVYRRALTIERPFLSPGAYDVPPAGSDVAADAATLRAVAAGRFRPGSRLDALVAGPHRIVAAVEANAADACLGAGLSVNLFDGISPRRFAVRSAAAPWRSTVAVEFADGTVLSRSYSASSSAPVLFSPVLSYPDPAAVAITIALQVQGSPMCKGRFPLAPDPSGRFAMWAASDFRPHALPETADTAALQLSTATAVRFPSALALIDTATRRASAVVDCPDTCFAGLLPASTVAGAWDYGRARFYAFSSRGIFTVTASAARTALVLNCLDTRAVTDPSAVAAIDSGRVAAVAGGDLVEVSRSKVTTVAPGVFFDRVGWHPLRGELWCFPPRASARIYSPRSLWRYSTADLGSPLALFPSRRFGMILTGADATAIAEPPEAPSGQRLVRWRATVRFPDASVPSFAKLPASASALDATFAITHGHLPDARAPVASFSMSGRLAAPLARRILCRAVDCLTVDFSGSVSSDFFMSTPEIFTLKNGKHSRHPCAP